MALCRQSSASAGQWHHEQQALGQDPNWPSHRGQFCCFPQLSCNNSLRPPKCATISQAATLSCLHALSHMCGTRVLIEDSWNDVLFGCMRCACVDYPIVRAQQASKKSVAVQPGLMAMQLLAVCQPVRHCNRSCLQLGYQLLEAVPEGM